MDEKPTKHVCESMSNTSDNYRADNVFSTTKELSTSNFNGNERETSESTLNHTISILTTYAFPKTSQYYSSKGKICILDQYRNEIIEYFITNKINIDRFYNSSINKSDFVNSAILYIADKTPINNTKHINNYNLQTAIKKLYTILHTHQHINHGKSLSEPILDIIKDNKFNHLNEIQNQQTHKHQRQRRNSIKDEIVHELSRTKSEVIILKEVADETQKQLTQTEQEKIELKRKISKISNVNKKLQESKEQILFVNRKLTNENIKLKQTVMNLKGNDNVKDVNANNFNVTDENKSDMFDMDRGNSLSLSNYFHQTNLNLRDNDENENDTTQLLQLNDNDIADLSMFYKKMKVKKKKKKNFWERLFEDFKCIPSLN